MIRLRSLFAGLVSLGVAVSLAACGSKDEATNGSAPSVATLKNVPPPAGKKWTEVVAATPDGGFVMGNPDAPIKVIEFGSFTCPHCRDFSAESAEERNQMVETGKMSFEYRTFIRDPIDMTVALIAHCGGPQPFFPLSEQLFQNQTAMIQKVQGVGEAGYAALINKPMNERFVSLAETAGLLDFAKQRGLAETQLRQCLADTGRIDTLVKQVQADTAKYTIEGTPTLVMNGSVVKDAASWQVMRARLKEAGL